MLETAETAPAIIDWLEVDGVFRNGNGLDDPCKRLRQFRSERKLAVPLLPRGRVLHGEARPVSLMERWDSDRFCWHPVSRVTCGAGERPIKKPMQCPLDLVKVVLMDAVEQAAVDQAQNIGGADLNGKTEKSAGMPVAMPSLTDGGGRFSHDPWLLKPTSYNITDLVAYRRSNDGLLGHPARSTCSARPPGRVAGATIVLVDARSSITRNLGGQHP
jgi:hypothetical protein